MTPAYCAGPPQYLLIGHVTRDVAPDGDRPGGTAAYAGLTAAAYGVSTALLTACGEDCPLSILEGMEIRRLPSERTTIFENRYAGGLRSQIVHATARPIGRADLPADWRMPAIVHWAPVIGELAPDLLTAFPHSLRCATLQGWMRGLSEGGAVRHETGDEAFAAAAAASAVVFSLDDVGGDEALARRLADRAPAAAVTDGARGCAVYWDGRMRRFPAPQLPETDPTGAGDIFAALFFLRFHETRDAFEAARLATFLASRSVMREGLGGVPTRDEIRQGKLVSEEP